MSAKEANVDYDQRDTFGTVMFAAAGAGVGAVVGGGVMLAMGLTE